MAGYAVMYFIVNSLTYLCCHAGYGATTFPALTEALMFEHNSTLAELEADRLTDLLVKLTHRIRD